MLSMHQNEQYVLQALRAGAADYLLKGARISELDLAVTSVARGEIYLSPAASKHVVLDHIQRLGSAPNAAETRSSPDERLTPRQREILQMIAARANHQGDRPAPRDQRQDRRDAPRAADGSIEHSRYRRPGTLCDQDWPCSSRWIGTGQHRVFPRLP